MNKFKHIPKNGIYIRSKGNITLKHGDCFPQRPKKFDRYEEGDYIYIYGINYIQPLNRPPINTNNGWAVMPVKNRTKAKYGRIRTEIAGKHTIAMLMTFSQCANMKKSHMH